MRILHPHRPPGALATLLIVLATAFGVAIAQQPPHAHVHPAVEAGSEILPPLGMHGWHHQVVEVVAGPAGFRPSTLTVRQGEPFVVVFSNTSAVEHHFHIMGLEPEGLSWFMVTANDLAEFGLTTLFGVERARDHICSSVTGICRLGINVHLHAEPMAFDAVMFTAPTAGTFEIACPLHPDMHATITVVPR